MFDVMLLQGPGSQYRSMVDQLQGIPSPKANDPAAASQFFDPNTHNLSNNGDSSSKEVPADTATQQYSTDGDSFEISGGEPYKDQVYRESGEAELSEGEQEEVKELIERDSEVKRHEQAHASAAGAYSRGISYEYTTGPDKVQYATGGQVDIDMSPVSGDPEATVQKMQTIQRAASAPEEPSTQDRKVEAEARMMETEARQEMLEEDQAESQKSGSSNPYQRAQNSQSQFEASLQSQLNLMA